MLRVLGNLVDKGSYHVLVFVHDIVFSRIAEILLTSFCYILFLVGGLFDDVVALRIVGQLLQPLNLGDIERVDRLVNKCLVLLDNAALANFCCIGIHHLLYQKKIGI